MVRQNAETVGLFGSAGQAANQLLALKAVRPNIRRVRVYSRDPENRLAFARKYGPKFNLKLRP
jgi:ornithine cyclodeaminase/alanine dehydrogenase-like protein (mu-crystallin family)